MRSDIFQYDFDASVPTEDVEATLVLALVGAESLHGECQVQLATPYLFDAAQRRCVVDASTPVGQDFNRLLMGFLRGEFDSGAFQVRREPHVDRPTPSAA